MRTFASVQEGSEIRSLLLWGRCMRLVKYEYYLGKHYLVYHRDFEKTLFSWLIYETEGVLGGLPIGEGLTDIFGALTFLTV